MVENGYADIAEIPRTLDVGFSITYKCNEGFSFRSDGATERVVTCLPGAYYSHLENCQGEFTTTTASTAVATAILVLPVLLPLILLLLQLSSRELSAYDCVDLVIL